MAPWTVTESERSATTASDGSVRARSVHADVQYRCSKLRKKMGEGSRD